MMNPNDARVARVSVDLSKINSEAQFLSAIYTVTRPFLEEHKARGYSFSEPIYRIDGHFNEVPWVIDLSVTFPILRVGEKLESELWSDVTKRKQRLIEEATYVLNHLAQRASDG